MFVMSYTIKHRKTGLFLGTFKATNGKDRDGWVALDQATKEEDPFTLWRKAQEVLAPAMRTAKVQMSDRVEFASANGEPLNADERRVVAIYYAMRTDSLSPAHVQDFSLTKEELKNLSRIKGAITIDAIRKAFAKRSAPKNEKVA